MPIVFVPSTRPSRILKAVVLLFLLNLFLGGGLGLFVESELRILPNDPFYGIGAGIVLANVGTYVLVRALYRRAVRVAAARLSLGDFLDDMLYVLLGIEGGFPIAALVAV